MIDIHCHILPDTDDGPETIDESLEMCRMAASEGIETIVVTPHFRPGKHEPSSGEIYRRIELLTCRIKQDGIGIRLLPGADVRITPELSDHLRNIEHLTINKTGRYFLAEFPSTAVPPDWENFLLSFVGAGIIPVITHPERSSWFLNNPDALYNVVSKGVLVQITAMSLTGGFGDDAQEFCVFLLEHNLAHVIATDAHSVAHRPPRLKEAVELATEIIGRERAESLVSSTPAAIIEGKPIGLPVPIKRVKKKKTWIQRLSF